MPVNEMRRKRKESEISMPRKQDKGFGSDEEIHRAPEPIRRRQFASDARAGGLQVARIQTPKVLKLTERYQLSSSCTSAVAPHRTLSLYLFSSLLLCISFHSMRPQLFRAAARSVRVPKATATRAFATTIPRSAEVELTIGTS